MQVVERAEVIVVVELGVEHDGGAWSQSGQRAVGFVGLRHDEPAAADARIRAELGHRAADQERRLLAALRQHEGDQCARARLAVRPGHADAVGRGHDVGQHVGPVTYAQPAAARGSQLRLVVGDRARDDDLHVPVQVRGIVADLRVDALGAQLLDRGGGAIASRDRSAVALQHARDARHAGATDAHQVHLGAHVRPRARRRSSRATAAAASGRAQLSMPRACPRAGRACAQVRDARLQELAVERRVVDDHRSAGPGEVLGIRALMVARGMGIGYEQGGQAGRCELPDGAAGAAHAQIGGRKHVPEAVGRLEHPVALRRSGHGRDDRGVIARAGDVHDNAVLRGQSRRRPRRRRR